MSGIFESMMTSRPRQQRRPRFGVLPTLSLLALALFPGLACLQLARSVDPRFVCAYVAAISALTLWLYWHDKRRAIVGGWRTPESTLHLLELLGGWPAAFLAQRAFRHKISKVRYQVTFWLIVALHQAVTFDFLSDWRYSQATLALLHR